MFGRHNYGVIRFGADQVLMLDQFTVTALLKKLDLTAQGSFDLELLKKDVTSALNADLDLLASETHGVASDALMRGLVTSGLSLDALIQKLGLAASADSDTLLELQDLTITASGDVLLRAGLTIDTTIDVLLKARSLLLTIQNDLLLRKEIQAQAMASALLSERVTKAFLIDATLFRPKWVSGEFVLPLRDTNALFSNRESDGTIGRRDQSIEVKP